MSDPSHDKSPVETAKELWKRSERARAAAQIPFVIWQAGNVAPQPPMQTDVPNQQRIERRTDRPADTQRVQRDQQLWAKAELDRLRREASRAGETPSRTQDRSRRRD
jgi:hypothetical protein